MLCYLGTGLRRYGENPTVVCKRPYWEFQAVLSGSIGMVLEEGPELLHSHRLWLAAPGHAHGWTGEPGKVAEVVVFHFLSIPEPIKQRCRQNKSLEIPLTAAQCNRLRKLARAIGNSWQTPRPEMILHHEHILLELSLLVCEAKPEALPDSGSSQRKRVHTALAWFHLNMESNPSQEEIAGAAGTSSSHLRRLFHEVMQASPKKILDQLRFQRAMHLMTDPETKLSAVSEACGFESPSAFSRAFKKKFGCSPDKWRG